MSFSESEKEYSSESEKSLENYASAESEDEIDKTVDGSFIDHGESSEVN